MTRTVVVTGSHTDIGKTWVSCRLVERLVADGARVDVRKPVMSGFEPARPEDSDAGRLLLASGRTVTAAALVAASPWRFPDPIAPDAAARRAGTPLSRTDIVAHARASSSADVLLVELAGGVMSPIAEDTTCLDVIDAVAQGVEPDGARARVVLVVGAYLGGISHGLTAHLALASRGLEVAAVVVNRASQEEAAPFFRFLPAARVLAVPEGARADDPAIAALAQLVGAPSQ